MTRFFVSFVFIILVISLPIKTATIISVIYGLVALAIFSYIIADTKKLNPVRAIVEHLFIAIIIIFLSQLLGGWIIRRYS
ncbi:MAG: hypothetical protein M1334_04735 [Patescibacteria group bacterium]|nr:hypothetical protein [Patescibacteria group bacterium]